VEAAIATLVEQLQGEDGEGGESDDLPMPAAIRLIAAGGVQRLQSSLANHPCDALLPCDEPYAMMTAGALHLARPRPLRTGAPMPPPPTCDGRSALVACVCVCVCSMRGPRRVTPY
jgi:hypothetical protein